MGHVWVILTHIFGVFGRVREMGARRYYMGSIVRVVLWAFWVRLWVMFCVGMTHTKSTAVCASPMVVGHVGYVFMFKYQ